jgi:hypothetical protein
MKYIYDKIAPRKDFGPVIVCFKKKMSKFETEFTET